ncbi:MAG: 23S rRNA (adenine(1618)-N(6))-methyltransferase RlmF [Litorilituus sp.]|nr:23S rRNA (adenine(1618)-N(6))-methyltransferase RlmF [Litorilituus sp.]
MNIKKSLHTRNKHRQGYEFTQLAKVYPELAKFIIDNKHNQQPTIDFANSNAVKALNASLLKKHYQIQHWDFPTGYLCPAIPGRVDYIHYLADLLTESDIHSDTKVSILDIGTGASCIYPILGAREYNWHFVASDIDPMSIKAATANIKANTNIAKHIECRLQSDSKSIFSNIIKKDEFYHLTLCNPPFHKSLADARAGTVRKWQNLQKTGQPTHKNSLNFGGQKAELWCQGGELAFIRQMFKESKVYRDQVLWFTCLVSKKDHIAKLKLSLKKANVTHVKVVNMAQGQKVSRFIAWSFSKL